MASDYTNTIARAEAAARRYHLGVRAQCDEVRAAIQTISGLGEAFDFRNERAEGAALDAIEAGRAGYWISFAAKPTPASYHDAVSLVAEVNRTGLRHAIAAHGHDIIIRLIPLNALAALEMQSAWAGLWKWSHS